MSLKKFEILEMIAKGGMAEVYRAKTVGFSGFEKEVCVKKILPHLTEDKSFVDMFVNEAKLAATLNYANIVQVHDLCVSGEGEYFIVMEYVNGKDLSDVIRAAQLAGREVPPEIAVYVCRETCKGLHYAHSKVDTDGAPLNIIHRDISPHNVLVSFMGEVKIVDFGIAKASSIMNKTAVGILKGKYGYMSPEQARGQPLDHRSDIFNTGIVLYELLVGERCFAGSSDFSTLNLMRNAEVTPPTKINGNVPRDLERIVLNALSLKKESRYPDALALESALAEFAVQNKKTATASDLAEFMQSLFADARNEERGSASTGVLSLSSVVGPPPAPPSDDAEPGSEAIARAKRRATRGQAPAPEPVEPPIVDAIPIASAAKAPPSASLRNAVADAAPGGRVPHEDALGRVPHEDALGRVPHEDALGRVPHEDASAKKRKPARLKPVTEAPAKKPKKKGKQLSDGPKKPVGRQELRPGLTQLHRIRGGNFTRRFGVAAGIIAGFTMLGAIVGWYRGHQMSRQTSFREMELVGRETTSARAVNVFIDSVPRGAKVRLDGLDLAGETPLSVERDRDEDEHRIQLSLDGHRAYTRSIKYSDGPVTIVTAQLDARPGRLEVDSTPPRMTVTIDGKVAGNTPLVKDVPFGRRKITVGGTDGYAAINRFVNVAEGKTSVLDVEVPLTSTLGQLVLRSDRRARIYIDGKPTRHWTNGKPIELMPDTIHRLGLRARGDKTRREIEVQLRKGEKRTIFLDLSRS